MIAGLVHAQSSWQLKTDSMNLGILVLDYQTYAFEKGNLSMHQPCTTEDADSLPFTIHYLEPGDFGRITFLYNQNLDTLFDATIIWMGQGGIGFPTNFLPTDSFQTQQSSIADPISKQYFIFDGPSPSNNVAAKADSAWNAVKSLQVVKAFSQHQYRVGIYLYPPSVGSFRPSVAKWIVFLYQAKLTAKANQSLQTESHHSGSLTFAYKADSKIAVTYQVKTAGNATVAVCSVKGVKVADVAEGFHNLGSYTANFDAGRLARGAYFFKLTVGNVTDVKKIVIGRQLFKESR